MRKAFISALLVTLVVGLVSAPATADPLHKTTVIPLDYAFETWNPCTEVDRPIHFTGELQVMAVPSIEAFFEDTWTHLTLKWTGEFVAEDAYSTAYQHYATQVLNASSDDPPHVAITETTNIVFNGDDGGKYKVKGLFHVTVVEGGVKTLTDNFDARCIQMP